ncbi:MAG: hypothetical protein D3910_09470 [Candidatus Electrothrix sp. ATG2]|nr:hypothetical protein [Candidatus Electrothrix sp. ATG2]
MSYPVISYKKGCTVPLTDVLIASVAQRNDMAVLTLDKYFEDLSVECVEVLEGQRSGKIPFFSNKNVQI